MNNYLIISLNDKNFKNHLEYLGYYLKKVLNEYGDITIESIKLLCVEFIEMHNKILSQGYYHQYFTDPLLKYSYDDSKISNNIIIKQLDDISNLDTNEDTLIINLNERVRGYYWIQ